MKNIQIKICMFCVLNKKNSLKPDRFNKKKKGKKKWDI